MECLICKRRLQIKERVAKIICANILDHQDCIEYDQPEEEGMVHVDCFKRLLDAPEAVCAPQDSTETHVERTNILGFLGE